MTCPTKDYINVIPQCMRCGGQVMRGTDGRMSCIQCGHSPQNIRVYLPPKKNSALR